MRQAKAIVIREKPPNYHYLTRCVLQLKEVGGGGGDVEVGVLLCV
jgi:hypothetical protein